MINYIKSLPGIISLIGILILVTIALIPSLRMAADANPIMPIIVSLVVLVAALYVILSGEYSDEVQRWAFSVIGIILGYWLPTK